MSERRKRLIEVAFPLEEVSVHSRREKNVRQGHISTLHIWWARRPLAACRAFIYASLVDDPDDDAEREELLKEVADLASWDAVRHPGKVVRAKEQGGSGVTGSELLKRARKRILDCNDGVPPRLLDPFAGGGAIPLEALRLGCKVEASDLNPVAVLILKGTVEYPQKFGRANSREVPSYIYEAQKQRETGQTSFFDHDLVEAYKKNPLATDVRYWGNWIRERASEQLGDLYPLEPDGSTPVAYLWTRTIPCPNCRGEMPLIRQYWLARKANKKVALYPIPHTDDGYVEFVVRAGALDGLEVGEASASLGDIICLLCHQVVKGLDVRNLAKAGKMGARMSAVIHSSKAGKAYRSVTDRESTSVALADQRFSERLAEFKGDLPLIPDEPMPTRAETTGGVVSAFGLDSYGKLFSPRQLLALTTFSALVRTAWDAMGGREAGEYANAVTTYLALAVDRLADRSSTLCRWDSTGESIMNTFGRQALPMVWDYAEVNPFSGATGDWSGAIGWISGYLWDGAVIGGEEVTVASADARTIDHSKRAAIITDPPYYDAINYSNLSDYFYVWLKRSLGFLENDLLDLPLTPKRQQIIMNTRAQVELRTGEDQRDAARRAYVEGMAEAFSAMGHSVLPHGIAGVVFAHTDPDAWATLIEGLLDARLIPDASWPIDTELENKVARLGQARLSTSVWMACTPRARDAGNAFLGDVMMEMRPVIRERLIYFWSKGIRGADFFISAIGPALSVFGRHSKVMRPDGSEVTVQDFLDLVRRESTQVALEQVLQGADLGMVDATTQQFVTWVWSASRAPLDAGEAIALCLATGADYGEVVRTDSIAAEVKDKNKKTVRLRTIKERGERDEHLGLNQPARPAPLIDQLQRSAWLWSVNRTDELTSFRSALGETRWQALRTLGQAVAECLPDADDDRRLINGLLSSSVMATAPPKAPPGSLDAASVASRRVPAARAGAALPGFEAEDSDGG